VRHRLLSIGVISLAGLIAGCGVQEREQGYLQRGLALFDRGDFDGAKLDFKNVLQIDEGQAQAWYGLARVEEKQGDYADAIGAYARVLQLNPTNISAKVRRGILPLRAMESEARARSPRIWSPPGLQGSVVGVTGTGLLPYIRPVYEEALLFWPR
jgi:tetratricopeptide (TPR) repeat protein